MNRLIIYLCFFLLSTEVSQFFSWKPSWRPEFFQYLAAFIYTTYTYKSTVMPSIIKDDITVSDCIAKPGVKSKEQKSLNCSKHFIWIEVNSFYVMGRRLFHVNKQSFNYFLPSSCPLILFKKDIRCLSWFMLLRSFKFLLKVNV